MQFKNLPNSFNITSESTVTYFLFDRNHYLIFTTLCAKVINYCWSTELIYFALAAISFLLCYVNIHPYRNLLLKQSCKIVWTNTGTYITFSEEELCFHVYKRNTSFIPFLYGFSSIHIVSGSKF